MAERANLGSLQHHKLMLDKQRVQRQFDRSAAVYNSLAGMQEAMAVQLLDSISPEVLTQAKAIVDLGCGTGVVLQHLQKRVSTSADVFGLDLALGMLQQANNQQPDVCYQQGDIEMLPYADDQFDIVLSNAAIQWCDLQTALAEMIRVSKPGATLCFSTFLYGTLEEWRQQWMPAADQEQHRMLSKAELATTMQQFPLANTSIKRRQWLQPFASLADATKSVSHLGAGNASQTRTAGLLSRQRYQNIQQWFNQQRDNQGIVHLPYQVAFISARVTK